jgi:hypothetical protein
MSSKEEQKLKSVLIEEAWQRGDLRYKLHAGQRKIYESIDKNQNKLFVANCSRQWGKSFLMVIRAIELALKKPKSRIKYATSFMTDLSEFIIPAFNLVLEDCPEHLKPKFFNRKKYIFNNQSEILLTGVDKNPNSLRGNTIDLIILDEVGFMKGLNELYKDIIMPATLHRPNAKIIMISTPPESTSHDFVDFVQEAQIQGNYRCFTIYDNPLLTPHQIEKAMMDAGGEKSTSWRREYLCEFVTESNKMIVPEWTDHKADLIRTIEPDRAYEYHKKYIGMDVGVKDFTAAVFGHYNFARSTLYIEDEFRLNDRLVTPENIADQIKTIRTRLWGAQTPYTGICDIDKLLINSLSISHKEYFFPVQKQTLINMVQRLRSLVKAKQIIIDPRCVQLLACLDAAIWDSSSMRTQEFKSFARSKNLGHFDHLAALIYLVMHLDRTTDPVPAYFDVDLTDKLIIVPAGMQYNNYKRVPTSIQNFAKLLKQPNTQRNPYKL